MNAILFRSYSTIHITPESGSSYASFETNQKVASYKPLISNVIRTFRPKRFVMTLLADEGGLKHIKKNPLTDAASESKIIVPAERAPLEQAKGSSPVNASTHPVKLGRVNHPAMVYKRSSLASIKVEEDCCCIMGNWSLEPAATSSAVRSTETVRKMRGISIS